MASARMASALRIGTRGSSLALWQARHVAELLRQAGTERTVELVEIETAGDQVRDQPLGQIGGEGVFTKAIQEALLAGRVDVAVHSLKDLPTAPVAGLVLAATPRRGPAGDALIAPSKRRLDELRAGAALATGSLRRRAQILHRRPDLKFVDMRGNVETRLRKLVEQNLDGLILAEAGLARLGLTAHITEILDASWMLPAVGQGALGLECRDDDRSVISILQRIDDAPTRQAVLAERSFLRGLGGGCQMPIGAAASVQGPTLTLRGAVLSPSGSLRIDGQLAGPAADAENVGAQLAQRLLAQGAREIMTTRS